MTLRTESPLENWNAGMLAVKAGHEGVVRVLSNHCPQIKATDRHGKTAQQWAEEKNFPRILKLLKETRPCKTD